MKTIKTLCSTIALTLVCSCPENLAANGAEGGAWVVAPGTMRTTSELMELATQRSFNQTKTALLQRTQRRTATYRQASHKPLPLAQKADAVDQFAAVINQEPIVRSPAQTVGLNFTAATVANTQDPFVIPPNLNGWVGPNQYVLMTYQIMRSFNKTTGLPDGILELDAASFFGVSANDVRIEYDRFYQRWLMSCENVVETTGQVPNLVLAISGSSVITATTPWYFYTITNAQVMPQISPKGSGDLDFQQLTTDKNNIYISVDTFNKYGEFAGSSVVVIPKSSITPTSLVSKILYGVSQSSQFVTPIDNFDASPTFGYLINASNYEYPSNTTYNKLYFYRISNPGTASQALSTAVNITVPTYSDPANAPYQGNLFGSMAFLQTSGSSLVTGHVRNHQLYVCHNIQINSAGTGTSAGDRTGIRWYQFDLTGDATGQGKGSEKATTVPALIQSGTLYNSSATNPTFYFIPSIMTNKNGAMVIACTASSAITSPNVVYAGRSASDTKGTLRTPVSLTSSTYPYNMGPFVDPSNANIGQRWGDLSSLCPEPVNDLEIWATQEFAAIQNGWGVQVTQLIPAV